MNGVESPQFRQLLGRFATGVTVLTTRTPDGRKRFAGWHIMGIAVLLALAAKPTTAVMLTVLAAGYALNRFEGMNNEPDMEAPWAYHYAGRPDRTAEVVHAALTWQYGTGPGGLPGNDDSGALSSWYVWASLGLFPLAGQSLFLVNAPAFGRSALRVDGGEFVVETSGQRETSVGADGIEETPPTQYVQAARLNGRPLETSYIRAADVHNGGVLHLELGPEPSPWGRSVRPPSLSDARTGGATA